MNFIVIFTINLALFQALEVIRVLKESIPIERVKMKIRISIPISDSKKCKDQIKALFLTVVSEDHDGPYELVR